MSAIVRGLCAAIAAMTVFAATAADARPWRGHRHITGTVHMTVTKVAPVRKQAAQVRATAAFNRTPSWPAIRLAQKVKLETCRSTDVKIEGLARVAVSPLEVLVRPLIRPAVMTEPMDPWQFALLDEVADARAFLLRTASPGDTMRRDGPENNIRKLVPEMVLRFAAAFREARADPTLCWFGKRKARVQRRCFYDIGLYSSYRAAAWNVGGFKDKTRSWHSAGLAADVHGIGESGSPEAQRWFQIAGRNGLFNPYGPSHWKEWNHYQLTMAMGIPPTARVLKRTIARSGPVDLFSMWAAAEQVIRYTAYVGPAPEPRRRYARRRVLVAHGHRHHLHYARVPRPSNIKVARAS